LPNFCNTVETIRMLAFLKTLFRGRATAPESGGGLAMPRTVYTAAAPQRTHARRAVPKPVAAPVPVAETNPVPELDSNGASGSDVDISLQSVLKGLPDDLKDRVRDLDIRGATMTISLERILAQLPSGAVKISFGSLRHAAPQLFSAGADCDSRDVALPLDEIMAKINPAMICPPQQPARGPIEEKREFTADTDTFVPAQPTAAPSRGSTLSVPAPSAPGETVGETPDVPPPARSAAPEAAPRKSPIRVPVPQAANKAEKADSIEVVLSSLAEAWPAELRAEIARWNLAEAKVALPVESVREGLKRGRVAFLWKTLRSWIAPLPPAGESAHDNVMLEVPLSVITPLFISGQKQSVKPFQNAELDEIPDLFFDARKGGGDGSSALAVEAPRVIPTAEGTQVITETETVIAETVAAETVAAETRSSAPVAEVSMVPLESHSTPAQPANDGSVMRIPINDLFESWPAELRAEIGHWNLPQLMVSLPAEQIDAGLKQGKVAFPWKTLRSWIVPAPPSGSSAHDKAILELPLPVIMPLFLAGRRPTRKASLQIADDIPDPFADFLPPRPATPAPAPSNTTTFVADKAKATSTKSNSKAATTPEVVEKSPKSKSSKRKQTPAPAAEPKKVETPVEVQPQAEKPVAQPNRFPTPVEILASAVGLDGVAGALVALSDGFKVASKLPAGLDGDTLAAFLPHIFSKVNQSTRELRMGDLNNLNFTVDNIPWKIFRVNQLFFAALGHAGTPMPTEQLAALANKLTFKN
jgi:predicted regulator of Ras-like GTPase activity (Roadblock/LC7/MglB family)